MLTLAEAIKSNRLTEFIEQEERRGVGPADRKKLEALLEKTTKPIQSEDRTLRSSSRGGSSGK